jgi:hypothetical protein
MLVPAALLHNGNCSSIATIINDDSSVIRKVGRAHYIRGTASDLISVPQYIIVVWGCILNGTSESSKGSFY